MLKFHAQGLRVTSWINTSHASVFTRQQGFRKDQPAPRPAKHSSPNPIVASHLCMIYLGLQLQRQLLSYFPIAPGCYSEVCMDLSMDRLSPHWSDSVIQCIIIAWFSCPHYLSMTKQKEDGWGRLPQAQVVIYASSSVPRVQAEIVTQRIFRPKIR